MLNRYRTLVSGIINCDYQYFKLHIRNLVKDNKIEKSDFDDLLYLARDRKGVITNCSVMEAITTDITKKISDINKIFSEIKYQKASNLKKEK